MGNVTAGSVAKRDAAGRWLRDCEGRPGGILRDLMAVALLWALVLAFFWRIALAGRVLAGGDVFTYFYPYWAEATRAFQAGRLPLWNPYLFLGAPFVANSQVGVFYPLNWPLWLLLPAHQSVHLTIVLHLCLAALSTYVWGRASLRLGRVGAWTAGALFALGGYLGAQVEHVNQLQGLAWLPLALALWDGMCKTTSRQSGRAKGQRISESANQRGSELASERVHVGAMAGLSAVVGLILLAGHTQTAFISLVGLAEYGLGPAIWRALRWGQWKPVARRLVRLAAATGLGITLAAVQLVPTWELTRLSVRAGGLPFNERVSFSLSPLYLAQALLPAFDQPVPPDHIEHVATIGIAGLALAALGMRAILRPSSILHSPSSPPHSALILLALGLFLSLGLYNPVYLLLARFVPGFAHFRAPARWLALVVAGAAAMAGQGAEAAWHSDTHPGRRGITYLGVALAVLGGWAMLGAHLGGERLVGWATIAGWVGGIALALGMLWATRYASRLATAGLLALAIVELYAASLTLPHSRATAPQSFTSLRPAIAHLLAAEAEGPPARFISMSDITFDPGDLPEMEVIYGPQLADDALYDAVVAAKQKEVLSPNLPLAFGIAALDGYGGGVLPLARYVALQQAYLATDEVSMDGRLRENLSTIPDGRWLNLFNVRHIITDKLHDAWLDDVFYDLQWGAQLSQGHAAATIHLPHFEATAVGLVSHIQGGAAMPDGTLAGIVEVGFEGEITRTFQLHVGQHTAEGAPAEGNDYVTRLRWEEPAAPSRIVVRATLPEGDLVVRGVSLIDERTGGFQALTLSDQGHFRLAHSGDVKIYENLDVLPRSFVVHRARAASDEAALALMQDPAFVPTEQVILSTDEGNVEVLGSGESHPHPGVEPARVTKYTPERIEIEVTTETPGYLVLTDTWYPGWKATVDGDPAPISRAYVLFRAIAVNSGAHRITFTYRPASLRIGATISIGGLLGLAVLAVLVCARALSKGKRGDIIGSTRGGLQKEAER